jgi:hypothetical protein
MRQASNLLPSSVKVGSAVFFVASQEEEYSVRRQKSRRSKAREGTTETQGNAADGKARVDENKIRNTMQDASNGVG